jgi:hypothetical protein
MPRILTDDPTSPTLTLDDLRREPGRLIFPKDAAALGIAQSYDGLNRLVKTGKLPKPYRIGLRPAWEARAFLQMLGASPEIPTYHYRGSAAPAGVTDAEQSKAA